MKIEAFNPPQRVLMGPGPSDVGPRVLSAMARPTIGHLDPLFIKMMDETKDLLQYVFQTKNQLTFAVSAPGSAGMECCFTNLVEPGDKVIVCQNGVFGGRMKENVERFGGIAIMVQDEWGTAVDLEKLEKALKYFVSAYEETPDNIELLNFLGLSYYMAEDAIMSEIYYQQALVIDPKNNLTNQKLGELYFNTERIDLAKEKLKILSSCRCEEYSLLKKIIAGKK